MALTSYQVEGIQHWRDSTTAPAASGPPGATQGSTFGVAGGPTYIYDQGRWAIMGLLVAVVAGLPTAATYENALAMVTNASGGRTLCISDGTNWKVFATEGATVTV